MPELLQTLEIGAYSVIGSDVEINENTSYSFTCKYFRANTKIGKENKIYPFASIGNDPQDLKFNGEKTKFSNW